MTIKKQDNKDGYWLDEKGTKVPYNRVTKEERAKEKMAIGLAVSAVKIQKALKDFKQDCIEACELAYQMDLKNGKASIKGGYTLFNFDRSIKVERANNDIIKFDSNLIAAAKQKFDEFLEAGTAGIDDMIREMVTNAFSSNKNNQLDTRKVFDVLSYAQRVDKAKFPKYHEAIDLVQQSIRRPGTRTYYRIFLKDENNEYQNIDLNFASI